MAHIFKIRTQVVELELKGKTYRLVDPKFEEKVNIQAEWDELDQNKDVDKVARLKKLRNYNLRQIRAYIPGFTDEDTASLTDGEIQLIIEAIMEAAKLNFGAVMEKPDGDEKK